MKTHLVKNLKRAHMPNFIHLIYLFLWVIAGVTCFLTLGHENFIFPILIFVWLLPGIGWFTVARWKWKSIVLAPIFTILVGGSLSILYVKYDELRAGQALDKFIITTANGNVSSEFSVGNEKFSDGILSKEVWIEMQNNISQNYTIEYSDNFFGAHEWIVRFSNDSAYFLSFHQTSRRHWNVSIERSR